MNKLFKVFKEGIVENNPIFVQFLGMCPTLAVTTSAINGLGMGLAMTFVLVMSEIIISLFIKNHFPALFIIPINIHTIRIDK